MKAFTASSAVCQAQAPGYGIGDTPNGSKPTTCGAAMNGGPKAPRTAGRDMTNAKFWPNSERTTAIQIHTTEQAKAVLAIGPQEVRRIAYSVRGSPLTVYEVRRTVAWVRNWVTGSLTEAQEVWGGDWTQESPESRAPGYSQK